MYRTIVLAYDGTRDGRLALREGARLAQVCGARVVLLAVVDPAMGLAFTADPVSGYLPLQQTDDVQRILDEGRERLVRMGLKPEARLETGEPAERIAAVAAETSADLVVVGHHQQGAMARWLLGSVTATLSDRLHCSLLVARLDIPDEVLFPGATPSPSA